MTPDAKKRDAAYLLTLPRAERNRILVEAAAEAAPEYEADLALPVGERELTAFTALDGEPFILPPEPDPRRVAELLAEIAALAMETGSTDCASTEHDRILYGGPKGAW